MFLSGAKAAKTGLALLRCEAAEVELVVIAEELAPLRGGGAGLGGAEALDERAGVGGGERVEEMLVDLEVEHHLQALAGVAEVFHVGVGEDVGFGEDDGEPLRQEMNSAKVRSMSYCSTGLRTLGPFLAMTKGTASMRKPETPSWIQKPMILRISAWTSGLEVLRSGWKS